MASKNVLNSGLNMRDCFQRTTPAKSSRAAVSFPETHYQGMIFIIQDRIPGKILLEHGPDIFIPGFFLNQAMTKQKPAGVGIHHEYRPIQGIQKNRISRFRSDSPHSQKITTQGPGSEGFQQG